MGGTLLGTRRVHLVGGPYHGQVGEVVGQPPALNFNIMGSSVTYGPATEREDGSLEYPYDPDLSPAHRLFLEADRQAILEVAQMTGRTPSQVLADARDRKRKAKAQPHPADALVYEARRRGVDIETLLAQLAAEQEART